MTAFKAIAAVAALLFAMAISPASAQVVSSCLPITTGPNHPASPVHYLSQANDNATNVSSKPVALCEVSLINTTGTIYYLKLYNTKITPVCGTDAVVHTYPVPASTSGNGITVPLGTGLLFSVGFSFCLTGGLADNDDTSAATGVALNFGVK